MKLKEERQALVSYGRRLSEEGLSVGTSGNLSLFDPTSGLMAITPSGLPYSEITAEDIVLLQSDGLVAEGKRKPSSEWALHAALYRTHPQARAVLHAHSRYCTTIACMGLPLEPVHYAIGAAGVGQVPCVPYHLFGSQALAQAAADYCGEGKAVLLGNHGMVLWEESMEKAFSLAWDLEFVAELQWRTLAAGRQVLLTQPQMEEALDRFQTYGQRGSQ